MDVALGFFELASEDLEAMFVFGADEVFASAACLTVEDDVDDDDEDDDDDCCFEEDDGDALDVVDELLGFDDLLVLLGDDASFDHDDFDADEVVEDLFADFSWLFFSIDFGKLNHLYFKALNRI